MSSEHRFQISGSTFEGTQGTTCFTMRVWNSLPEFVVDAETRNSFQKYLDLHLSFWKFEDYGPGTARWGEKGRFVALGLAREMGRTSSFCSLTFFILRSLQMKQTSPVRLLKLPLSFCLYDWSVGLIVHLPYLHSCSLQNICELSGEDGAKH